MEARYAKHECHSCGCTFVYQADESPSECRSCYLANSRCAQENANKQRAIEEAERDAEAARADA